MFKFLERMPSWGVDLIGIFLIIVGALGYIPGTLNIPILTDAYLDIRSELIGIGVTVIIIVNANELLRIREEKKRLILQMGSPDNGFAIEAVRQLRQRGWFIDGSLIRAYLGGADLREANLGEADLRGAYLGSANLGKADLGGADLGKADLQGANLGEADLWGANLQGANLKGATLWRAYLGKADLEGANLGEADLQGANLEGAKLQGADLRGANLREADLGEADLGEADLDGADLWRADLQGANLGGANLGEAILHGAILWRAKVLPEQLSQAASLEDTTMPDGKRYDPAVHSEVARLRKEARQDT